MKAVPDQIARWVPAERGWAVLGTDGYGRSDTREALRRHFETDHPHLVVATLAALADRGDIKADTVDEAIAHHALDPTLADPRTR
jgi:pyruvate dehydrogenase E1 component